MRDDAEELYARIRPSLRCFAPAELSTMCDDGDLQRHGIRGLEFYLPYGERPTSLDRARSLTILARDGRILTGEVAFWVHFGGPAPEQIEVSRRTGSRPRELEDLVVWCYRRIELDEVVDIGPIRLTSIERTLTDVRRAR